MEQKEIAKEGGHYYTVDGTPAYTVIGKNGKERGTTIADARKLNLLPSVTTILKTAAKPGLENWKIDQAIMCALTLTRNEGESDADYLKRVKRDSGERARQAAARGTELHGAIEQMIKGKMVPTVWGDHANEVYRATNAARVNLDSGNAERSFAHAHGFGGKVDWHSREQNIVLDFKTKDRIDEKVKAYDDHGLQLSAYALGLGMPGARRIVVFVGVEDCQVKIEELAPDTAARHAAMFLLLLQYWQVANNYIPVKEAA